MNSKFLKSLTSMMMLVAICCTMIFTSAASAEPKRIPFKDLPPEIQEKIKEKMKELKKKMEEAKEAAASETEEKSDEESDEEKSEEDSSSDEEKEKKKDEDKDKEEKKKEKSEEDVASEAVKKMKSEIQTMEAAFKHRVAVYKDTLKESRFSIEKAKLDEAIADHWDKRRAGLIKKEIAELKLQADLQSARLKSEKSKIDQELMILKSKKMLIEARLATKVTEENLAAKVQTPMNYPDQPFRDGILTISDRRIGLNGPIMNGTAEFITGRIHYYNNLSTSKPIFIVIDSSPGGSVSEGLQILQAMEKSKAPIHVVVKRFAASMAAGITTLADHSYIYPHAIILHHQISYGSRGNTTDHKERLAFTKHMSSRLVGAIAKKIGTTEEALIKEMYSHTVSGDWQLFGDEAVKRKWVENIVTQVNEESIRTKPKAKSPTLSLFGRMTTESTTSNPDRYEVQMKENIDDKGQPFVRLPRLGPYDCWYLYNPDGYYR